MKKLILSLLVAASLSIGSSAQAGKAKKLGKIGLRSLEVAFAIAMGGLLVERAKIMPFYIDREDAKLNHAIFGASSLAALYMIGDGCYGIYKALKPSKNK